MNDLHTLERFSPFGTPVAAPGGLLWEVETAIFRCRMPASEAMQTAVSLEDAVQDPQALAFFEMLIPKPPFQLLEATVAFFRGVIFQAGHSSEALVQLTYDAPKWGMRIPEQKVNATRVDAGSVTAEHRVGVEIHSHGTLPAYFSPTDDADEIDGFLYCVIGDVTAWSPSICLRVGHAGCFLDLSVDQVFELPHGLQLQEWPRRDNE